MNTEMKNAILATDIKAQYDQCAKRLLSQKIILAHILVKTVDEFKGMKPTEVVPLIVGIPSVSAVSVEPGLTNNSKKSTGARLTGLDRENEEINEGTVRFDIIFYVQMKNGLSQIIVNIEAQKDEPDDYNILNRTIYYVSRLISSQKERDFVNMNYDDIKPVYSIWVCMNMSEDSMCHVHLTKDDIIGYCDWKGNLDLMNIVMIGLSKKLQEHEKPYELHRLLGTLLSKDLSIDEKQKIIETEYQIPMEDDIRKDVSDMCNLSQGIEEEALEKGILQGIEQGIERGMEQGKKDMAKQFIIKLQSQGFTVKHMAELCDMEVEEVEKVLFSGK